MSDSCVYIADKDYGWLPANVLSNNETTASVKVFSVDGNEFLGEREVPLKNYDNQQLPLQNVDAAGHLMEMPDMVDLPSLHEAAILYNLRARHIAAKPYTRVGELIIAVNPFQWMPQLYSEDNRTKYVERLIYNTMGGPDVRAGLDPHVYETSCMAYRGLAVDGKHQSILVSGESGAGKTETVKIVMRHLSSVASSADAAGESKSSIVVQRVLDGQPLLEAFGNAKTVRNDNSSRFGKFIQMQFDVEDATQAAYSGRAVPNCVLAGSTCETYLLEKSRVVSHEPEERTYHIFYQVLGASAAMKKEYMPMLENKGTTDFVYVGHSDTVKIEGMLDGDRFEKTVEALKLLDMKEDQLKTLFSAVACVLQLGNITFGEDPEDAEQCVVTSQAELATLAEWSGIPKADLEEALTFRTVVAGRGESYKVPLKASDAKDGCDAFGKEIYQQVFEWLVGEINRMTCAENNYDDAQDVEVYGLIGLLDIFGFESFEINRFEQLCINYTNEKLQQKYTLDIFRSVQDEYSHEGIELGEISFADNAEVLRLIEGKIGIISVLNEECVRPKGNDTAFVSKVKTVNKEVTCLISEKLHKPSEFAIEHYAGVVKYDATNFVQKNTDALPKDMIECACKSSNDIIKVELKAAAEAKAGPAAGGGGRSTGRRGAATLTVATKFKSQLTRLMGDITQTNTRYIRCIKPNPEKVPLKMNMFSAAEQLRCAGVVAAVTISRVAFPNRLMHETALERFSCLSETTLEEMIEQRKERSDGDETGFKETVTNVFEALLKDMEKEEKGELVKAFEVGKSRIYFRLGALETLESKRLVALGTFAVVIERIVRGFTARSLFWKLKYATIDSQANARRVVARKKYVRAKNAAIDMECWVRCVFAKRELKRLQREKAATQIESRWRTVMAVAMFTKCKGAAVVMQKIVRGALQRPKYRIALKEAEEEARVNSKLAALQKRLQAAEMKYFQADKMRIEAEKRAAGLAGDGSQPPPAAVAATTTDAPAAPVAVVIPMDDESKSSDGPASEHQQALIDESNQMLDYFRKEVFKLKSANYLLRTDLAALQEDHRTLQSHAQATEASYSAMNKNIGKLSQNNMRMSMTLNEEKDFIQKLKKDLKMDKIRHVAELRRKDEEVLGSHKMHEVETSRMKRELHRLRKIIVDSGGEVPDELPAAPTTESKGLKFERASFDDPFRSSVLRSMNVHKKVGDVSTSLSKAALDDDAGASSAASDGDWNTVNNRQRPTMRRPPPVGTSYGSSYGSGKPYFNNSAPYSGRGPPPSSYSGGRGPPPPYSGRGPSPYSGRGPSPYAYSGRGPPRYSNTTLGAAAAGRGRGGGRGGRGLSPRYAGPPPPINTGTSLGAAVTSKTPSGSLAAHAKSGSSLMAAAKTPPTITRRDSGKSSLSAAASSGGSSLNRAATGKR